MEKICKDLPVFLHDGDVASGAVRGMSATDNRRTYRGEELTYFDRIALAVRKKAWISSSRRSTSFTVSSSACVMHASH